MIAPRILLTLMTSMIPTIDDDDDDDAITIDDICVFDLLITKRPTIKMTADDDSCSSYDSVSATDLTVGTTNSVTDTSTDNDTSSYDSDDVFYHNYK